MDFNISSKLLERMWETIEKTGIAIFRPWVMKRDAKARLHIENLDKLLNVQLEKRTNQLKQDSTNISINIDSIEKILVQDPTSIDVDVKVRKEPYLNVIAHQITENMVQREIQKEINLANTLKVTAEILLQDDGEPPTEQVEQDWIDRFREVASNTTTEEIQQLWGRILAGEIKSPGKHSLRTLEFIKNLSQKESQQIEKLFSFVIGGNGVVSSWEWYEVFPRDVLGQLSLDYLYDMQSLGIITGVGLNQSMLIRPHYDQDVKYYRISFKNCNCLCDSYIFKHDDDKNIDFYGYKLTKLGEELYDLCSLETDVDYLNYIVQSLEEQGFKKIPQNKIKLDFE
ncbi:DUF2806 domain-containing protein [Commensalibacter papalotli (ex Servin-Garciduenas et al. 2014)]|uniref:Membrane-fusion protein n=1 Tax=Commensalibacter papalotli (ex Servin-Garciduenas et al. 2014) TaxID=1208583 RepID=W7DVZ4_9PROT|nr:DUF2806 domain-containing protein [Commensalibacter papalotli (ex Servin-Garciduenas et al. 2014)]EUK18398.1 membrane-fusion protein [Commensalibacter papalotli (ex Servin-Garciduenas et al. 2014)]